MMVNLGLEYDKFTKNNVVKITIIRSLNGNKKASEEIG